MIILILFLALILRLVNLNQSFWLDEVAQVLESSRSFWQQGQLPIDFHPPLFHYLVYFWLKLGRAEWWLRTVSVLSGVATIYFLYLLVLKTVDKKTALLAALFLSISPFHIYYSQELRPYALATLLAVTSMYLFLEFLEGEKKWHPLFILINILGLYSLYFFPFLFAAQFLILFFLKRNKLLVWLKHLVLSSSVFLPWIPFFINQLETGREWTKISPAWAEMVSLSLVKALPLTLFKFSFGRIDFSNNWVYLFLVLFSIIFFVYLLLKGWQKKKKGWLFFSLYFLAPLFLSFLIHIFLPIINPKRLLLILPAFYVLLSLGALSLKIRKRRLIFALILLVSLYGLFQQYTNPYFQREQWRQAVGFIEGRVDANSIVAFSMAPSQGVWDWYARDMVETTILPSAGEANFEESAYRQIEHKNRVFFFAYLFGLSDPELKFLSVLRENGFSRADFYEFSGVGLIYEYKKNL